MKGQYFTASLLQNQVTSHNLRLLDSLAIFSAVNSEGTILVLFDINQVEIASTVDLDYYVLAPFIYENKVYALRQYDAGSEKVTLDLNIFNLNLELISSTPRSTDSSLLNYNVTSDPIIRGDTIIYCGNALRPNWNFNNFIVAFSTDGEFLFRDTIEAFGKYEVLGLVESPDNGYFSYGRPAVDSISADLHLLKLDPSFNVTGSWEFPLLELIQSPGTPFYRKEKHVGKAHEDLIALAGDSVLLSGTARSFHYPSLYQETDGYLCYFNLSDSQYTKIAIIGDEQSNTFGMFNPVTRCNDGNYFMMTTEGSSENLDYSENKDTRLRLSFFDDNLELVNEKFYFENDGVYQRLHSVGVTESGKIVIYGSEYIQGETINVFIMITDCEGTVLGMERISEQKNQDITVYPNPITNGRCTVKSESEIEFIDVFDSGGNRVFRSYSTEINFTNYASGIYQLGIKKPRRCRVLFVFLLSV